MIDAVAGEVTLACPRCGVKVEDEGLCVRCWDVDTEAERAYKRQPVKEDTRERHRTYMREYNERPEVKKSLRANRRRPEFRKKRRLYMRAYRQQQAPTDR